MPSQLPLSIITNSLVWAKRRRSPIGISARQTPRLFSNRALTVEKLTSSTPSLFRTLTSTSPWVASQVSFAFTTSRPDASSLRQELIRAPSPQLPSQLTIVRLSALDATASLPSGTSSCSELKENKNRILKLCLPKT